MDLAQTVLQVIVALVILNVWLLRSKSMTDFRGGDAKSLKEEFEVYGLSGSTFRLVGFLKVVSALGLVAGIWVQGITLPAAGLLAILMVGALAMHVKVRDPLKKSIPAATVLVLCVAVMGLA